MESKNMMHVKYYDDVVHSSDYHDIYVIDDFMEEAQNGRKILYFSAWLPYKKRFDVVRADRCEMYESDAADKTIDDAMDEAINAINKL